MQEIGLFNPRYRAQKFGFDGLGKVSYNLGAPQLYEEALQRGEAQVAKGSHGVSVRVELQEHSPNLPSSKEGHDSHEKVHEDTASVSELGDSPWSISRTKDIGSNQVHTS